MENIDKLREAAKKYRHITSEAEQLKAVQRNGYVLQYCHNPSEAVMLAAVQQDGYALRYAAKWL